MVNENVEQGDEPALSHAIMGEKWLEIHLSRVGKRKDELAFELWKNSITAVAEVSLPASKRGMHRTNPCLSAL